MYLEDNGSAGSSIAVPPVITGIVLNRDIRASSLEGVLANVFAHNKDIVHYGSDIRYLILMKRDYWFYFFHTGYQVKIIRTSQDELHDVFESAMLNTVNGGDCHIARYYNDLIHLRPFWLEFKNFMSRKMTSDSPIPLRVVTWAVVEMITRKPKKRFWFW